MESCAVRGQKRVQDGTDVATLCFSPLVRPLFIRAAVGRGSSKPHTAISARPVLAPGRARESARSLANFSNTSTCRDNCSDRALATPVPLLRLSQRFPFAFVRTLGYRLEPGILDRSYRFWRPCRLERVLPTWAWPRRVPRKEVLAAFPARSADCASSSPSPRATRKGFSLLTQLSSLCLNHRWAYSIDPTSIHARTGRSWARMKFVRRQFQETGAPRAGPSCPQATVLQPFQMYRSAGRSPVAVGQLPLTMLLG